MLKNAGAWGHQNFDVDTCIEKDGKLYAFYNIKSKLFHDKYGYFSEEEKRNAEEKEKIYKALQVVGINVIECLFA